MRATLAKLQEVDPRDRRIAADLLTLQRWAANSEARRIGQPVPAQAEQLSDILTSQRRWIALRHKGRLVAAIAWRESGQVGTIERLLVHPDLRRRGLGADLIKAIVHANPDLTELQTATAIENDRAHHLFLKLGFTVTQEDPEADIPLRYYQRPATLAEPTLGLASGYLDPEPPRDPYQDL